MTKNTWNWNRFFIALPSLLLTIAIVLVSTVLMPQVRQIEQNTDLQTKAFGDRLTEVEKQYQATLDRVTTMAERLENMELRLTILSIIPPTQALKLETTGDLERLIAIMKERQ